MHTGPQGKSDLRVRRADWTSEQCHHYARLAHRFFPPSTVRFEVEWDEDHRVMFFSPTEVAAP